MSENTNLETMRHSLSHIMAAAVKNLYSGTTTTVKFAVGRVEALGRVAVAFLRHYDKASRLG